MWLSTSTGAEHIPNNYPLRLNQKCFLAFQVHSEREMKRVLGLKNVELIGINNRSLGTFVQSSSCGIPAVWSMIASVLLGF